MAITKNAKKAVRVSARKRVYNIRTKSALHDTVKTLRKAITTKEPTATTTLMAQAYQAIDKAAKRGVIKKNTAARKKSRLMKQVTRTKE